MPNTLDVRQKAGLNAPRQSTSPASPGVGTPQTPPRSPAMVERRAVRPAIPLCPRGRSSVPAAARNFPLMINALLKKTSRPHARPNHGAKACPLPLAPRAAAPAPMDRTDPERPPQTDNDRRSGDAVTDLGNAAARRQRQPGGGSPATPSPGKEPLGKNRPRHGVKKQHKPEQSSYRRLRYAALNATAGEADAFTPLPTAALARGALPAATAINGDRPDARERIPYSSARIGAGLSQ